MKQGDVIAGYRVISEPTNANGGKCMWAFAEKDGQEFFLKRFLEPKRPRDGSTASAASRRIRLEVCEEFENRHRTIMKRLRPDAKGGGNLVLATDFFHEGSTYYKVTERIDTSTLEKPQSLDPRQKAVLLRTLAMSLRLLHNIDVVHGDLKPLNVLVQKRGGGAFHTAKLIDFDDSYVSGSPPGRQDIAGDSLYGAPEWRRYVQEDETVQGEQLTTAVDVFALGLITHYYLTGATPRYDERFGSPADAVNAGEKLITDGRLSRSMQGLIRAMTVRSPARRPRIGTYLKALNDPDVCALHRKRPGTAAPKKDIRPASSRPAPSRSADPTGTETDRKSRIRTNLKGGSGPRPSTDPAPEPAAPDEPKPAAAEPDPSEADPPKKTSRVRFNPRDRHKP